MKLLVPSCYQPLVTYPILGSNILLIILFSNTLNQCSSLRIYTAFAHIDYVNMLRLLKALVPFNITFKQDGVLVISV
jgi:hypothetical protein